MRLGTALALTAIAAEPADAACDQIPGVTNSFRGTLGSVDRPFAAPGTYVGLRLDAECDAVSPGFSAAPEEHVVTVVFTPPNGTRNAAVLAADCSGIESYRQACEARDDVGTVTCAEVNQEGDAAGIEVVVREGERGLRFRFPDTDPSLDGLDDDRTFTGPATIAVTARGAPLPCDLASVSCAAKKTELLACVDVILAPGGTCGTTPDPTFGHFTALPPANNYQALCTTPDTPCEDAAADELHLAIDAAGNILVPMDWRGILVNQGVPIPRLLRGGTSVEAFPGTGGPIRIPSEAFLSSFSLQGSKLPPIFDPQFDPEHTGSEVTLFGSADAPETVLRIARQSPR